MKSLIHEPYREKNQDLNSPAWASLLNTEPMVFSFPHSANLFLTKCSILVSLYLTMQDVSMYASLTVQYWSYRSFHMSFRFSRSVPEFTEFIDPVFAKKKPNTLVFSHRKRAFWTCFRENWVYKFGHWWKRCFFGVLQFFSILRKLVSITMPGTTIKTHTYYIDCISYSCEHGSSITEAGVKARALFIQSYS